MTLNININNFQGPFDLLLHLIKKNKMDIYDIKIYEVTGQYMDYLKEMKEIDLEITSEFIVIAATLLEIKSKMLLPKVKKEEDEEEEDPRKELVQKLIEYKKFKSVAEYFKEREQKNGVVYAKKPEIIEDKRNNLSLDEDIFKGITMLNLYNLFCKLMMDFQNKINEDNMYLKKISVDIYKVEDKMDYLLRNMKSNKPTFFSRVVKECSNKLEVIVTFMALLELIKLKSVKVYQKNNFNEIYIERIESNEES